jgi:hypothetical protein
MSPIERMPIVAGWVDIFGRSAVNECKMKGAKLSHFAKVVIQPLEVATEGLDISSF